MEDTKTEADARSAEIRQRAAGVRRRASQQARKRNKNIGIAAGLVALILAGVALWWFAIRGDDEGTTGQASVSSNVAESDPGVAIVQMPSLDASATIDGQPADEAVNLTFGEESELVVTVVNDGNLTMGDIAATLEFSGADGPIDKESDECNVPVLAPKESGDCTLRFTPTSEMTSVVARVLGYGPQEQEVDLAVTITLG